MVVDDCIVAIASARGTAGRGVVRLSGPESLAIVARLVDPANLEKDSLKRRARHRSVTIRVPVDLQSYGADCLDVEGALLSWPDSRSYTGQVAAELHVSAPAPILEMIVNRCCHLGARLARPGEFTMRSFLAGKMDLTQAEAVIGLIHAADESEFRTALSQLAGGLAAPFGQLREELLVLLADLEAGLDFVEEDIEFIDRSRLQDGLRHALNGLLRLRDQILHRGNSEELQEVVLVGLPNAGKSSLFNRLCDGSVAIVSDRSGTTRDYLSQTIQVGQIEFRLTDTAGVSCGSELLEQVTFKVEDQSVGNSPEIALQAQQQTQRSLGRADLILVCVSADRPPDNEIGGLLARLGSRGIPVATRTDLGIAPDFPDWGVLTSALTGAGVEELKHLIVEKIATSTHNGAEAVPATLLRCRESLRTAIDELSHALAAVDSGEGDEVVAAGIRLALDFIGEISGSICTDDLLDRIFSRFCIGK